MKEGIHPDYHEITVQMTDGSSYKTRSTYGKEGDTLRLDIHPKSHPAWTGGQHRLLDTGGQLARFNRRFQSFGIKTGQLAAASDAPEIRFPIPFAYGPLCVRRPVFDCVAGR